MDALINSIHEVIVAIRDFVWGPFFLMPLLLLSGLYLTVRYGGLQFRTLGRALKLGFVQRKDDSDDGDISQFQALTTALAATVGTGNIVGVATALSIGGPGALFWMWVTALLGMATKYSEAFLGVLYRTNDAKGEKSGGPAYYLERGLGSWYGKVLGLLFAIFAFFASFGIGNMTQGNSIASNVENSFNVEPWITGLILTVLTLVVLLGGIKSIGNVTSALVPVMIVFYVLGSLWLLIANAGQLPEALGMVFTDAFTGTSAVGGFAGSAMIIAIQYGVARGIFSNESGMGSAAIAAAAAKTTHPVRQGLVSMTQTFIDTIIVVTCTGLVLITTGAWQAGERQEAAIMTANAFTEGLPGNWGHLIVTIGLILFAYSTMLAWSYYGERNVERLLGRAWVMPYRVLFCIVIYLGCTLPLEIVWDFSDLTNGLMAVPNIIGLLAMSGLIARETKRYLQIDPRMDSSAEDIDRQMSHVSWWQAWRHDNLTEPFFQLGAEESPTHSYSAGQSDGRGHFRETDRF